MYADLVLQSGIAFDVFGLRLPMGQAVQGQYARDLMQLSSLFDQFAHFGKPLYLTVSTPSEPISSIMIADPLDDEPVDAASGYWRRPWSEVVQSRWAQAVFQIAVSKPYVEAIAWQDLIDYPNIELPLSGLLDEEIRIKEVFRKVVDFRRQLRQIESQGPRPQPDAAPNNGAGA